MIHDEIEELLGAYALDAVDRSERDEIEAHLAECPRCRAEVAAHQEMAAMFAGPATEAPTGLWEKISVTIADGGRPGERPPDPVLPGNDPALPANDPALPASDPALPANVVPLIGGRPWRRANMVMGAVAAVAAAAVAFLGVDVAHLSSQVDSLRSTVAGNSLTNWLIEPHQTITLASADHAAVAKVYLARDGQAVWYTSSLGTLPSSQTYQMWGLSHGQVVSLGLMGPDPRNLATFTVAPSTTRIMVTAEPEGGTAKPTTTVVASGNLPSGYVS